MYNHALLYIEHKKLKPMVVTFVAKLAKSGTDINGNERRIIIIPLDRLKDIKKYNGKQIKVTLEDIE